jgi:trimeric autotransporter adhesin
MALLSNWDVSAVTDMGNAFFQKPTFNEDISGWNTSSVTNMADMFFDAAIFNQNLSGWDLTAYCATSPDPVTPSNFDTRANAWDEGDATRPQWSGCLS